jgi:hypothetical protein
VGKNSGRTISCYRRRYKSLDLAIQGADWILDNTNTEQLWIYTHEWSPLRTSPEGEKVADCCAKTPGKVVYHVTGHPGKKRAYGRTMIMAIINPRGVQ